MMISWLMSPHELFLSRLFAKRIVVFLLERVLKVLSVVEIWLWRFQVVILLLKLSALELVVIET